MKCLVLMVTDENLERNEEVLKSSIYLKKALQETFQGAEINTQIIPKDEEKLKKALIFYTEILNLDFIITTGGGGDVVSDGADVKATKGLIPNDTGSVTIAMCLKCLEVVPFDVRCRFNYGIQDGTLIFNLPCSAEDISKIYDACKAVLPQVFKLLKNPMDFQAPLAPKGSQEDTSEIIVGAESELRSIVDMSKVVKTSVDDMLELDKALWMIFKSSFDFNRIIEYCSYENLMGKVLANDVIFNENIAPVSTSKVNGYAFADEVHHNGTAQEYHRKIALTVQKSISSHGCVKVNIGDPIPAGANSVIQVDYVTMSGDHLYFQKSHVGQNISHKAGIFKNEIIISKYRLVGPLEKGLLGHFNEKVFPVYSKPKITFISIEENSLNSASYKTMMECLLSEQNIVCNRLASVDPDPHRIKATLEKAFEISDIIIMTVEETCETNKHALRYVLMEDFEASVHFIRLSKNPGGISIFATCVVDRRTRFIFGLPGHMVNGWVAYQLIILPSLGYLMGIRDDKWNKELALLDKTKQTTITGEIEQAMMLAPSANEVKKSEK